MAGWETTHHNKYLIVLNLFFIFSIIQKKKQREADVNNSYDIIHNATLLRG